MSFTKLAWTVFNKAVDDYHIHDSITTPISNPYEKDTLEQLLYAKNWIDTVQWHLEDIIRDENIEPVAALELKREIDASNQRRTDLVEYIDSWFLNRFSTVNIKENARLNTESPAWALDRYSILALKIYHMKQEAERESASLEHKHKCQEKLHILLAQKDDLSEAIDQLLTDIETGNVKMKVYRQMKMYNDESLNPVLYRKKM